jgi:hypothetical protein
MTRRFGLFLLALGLALGLGSAAAPAYPLGDPLNTTYTFRVPVNLSDINADARRAPTVSVDVTCAVSENETTNPMPKDSEIGMGGTGHKSPSATKTYAIGADGNLSATAELVVKGTAYERSYVCWLEFTSKFKGPGKQPTQLNRRGISPMGVLTDLGHPYDDGTLKDVVHGLIN